MQYSLKAGGKRLRPIILSECAGIFGAEESLSSAFAAALEMIHTYSLIHDDLPAMDDDDLRRGKPTNHVVYGEAKAILAGDALLNSAHTIMLKAILDHGANQKAVKAAFEISNCAGVDGMIVGQIADIANETTEIDLNTLNFINENKTGALIEAAFVSGALLGGAKDEEISKLRKIAHNIGLSFQIIDDILDIEGDTEVIGKPVGSDAKNSKTTYPNLMGLEESKQEAETLTNDAVQMLQSLSCNTEFLQGLVIELLGRKL
jgi:geranylgeranyl diphosphate synthase type II